MPDPQPSPAAESPRALFERSLPLIDRVISSAARRLCLRPEESGDFASWVHLELIENDYGVLAQFGGRSSLATYLTAVIQNLARDYRIKNWGRWRPSAAAERLGLAALHLETRLSRDGLSLEEAVESVRANDNVKMSRLELIELAAKLPRRNKVRVEDERSLAGVAAEGRADERVHRRELEEVLVQAKKALTDALSQLGVTDRLVLRMHYESGLTISAIARALTLDQRQLYTRRDRCARHLKQSLEAQGLEAAEVLEALGWSGADFKIDFGAEGTEHYEIEPSNPMEPQAEEDS